MVNNIIIATIIVASLGLILGTFLGFASEKFKVLVDERVINVRECLPGNNCGGCGYAGCDAAAEAIVSGKATVNACPVGGKAVADNVAKILGVENTNEEKKVAFVHCKGTCDKTKKAYNYFGVSDCNAISILPNKGEKGCTYACIGYGSCVKVCKFDAIHIINGVAVVNKEKCTSCKNCIKECPMKIIDLIPYSKDHIVACNSLDKGVQVNKVCMVGCIGCKLCEKSCPNGAMKVENNLAKINYDLCTNCGICKEKCPRKIII